LPDVAQMTFMLGSHFGSQASGALRCLSVLAAFTWAIQGLLPAASVPGIQEGAAVSPAMLLAGVGLSVSVRRNLPLLPGQL